MKGVELGLVGQVTDKWQITAGVTRQDTEVTEGSIPTRAAPSTQTRRGHQLLAQAERDRCGPRIASCRHLTVGGGARHISTCRAHREQRAGDGRCVPDPELHRRSTSTAAYNFTDKIGLQVNAYNVFDEDYIASINNSGQRYCRWHPAVVSRDRQLQVLIRAWRRPFFRGGRRNAAAEKHRCCYRFPIS